MTRQTMATPSLDLYAAHCPAQRIAFYQARLCIGRRPFNDIVLDDRTVSGRHAMLHKRSGVIILSDMGSRNGTWVNGLRISRRILIDGDRIDVGIYTLTFRDESPTGLPLISPPSHLLILSGPRAGQSMVLDRALVSLRGDAGDIAVLASRRHTCYLTHLDGSASPQVNGEPIGLGSRQLEDQDLIEMGGTLFRFIVDPNPGV